LKAVADTGPLVSALNKKDQAHRIAVALLGEFGRDLIVPLPVLVEVDHLLRTRVHSMAARAFLAAVAAGEHEVRFMSPGMLQKAVEIDARHAGLDLGLADAAVMAIAEHENLPILTFDFRHFRATAPGTGYWRLVVHEGQFRAATDES
jgi:predicted nucleic acid-binding protein